MKSKKAKRQRPARIGPEPFTVTDRAIYRYFDGEKQVARDPLAILRALNGRPGPPLDADVKVSLSTMKESGEAFGRVIAAVRESFGVKPFEEVDGKQRGLTDGECLALLLHFGQYAKSLQDAALPFAISQPATGPPVSDGSAIPCSSDSTSTVNGHSSNGV